MTEFNEEEFLDAMNELRIKERLSLIQYNIDVHESDLGQYIFSLIEVLVNKGILTYEDLREI